MQRSKFILFSLIGLVLFVAGLYWMIVAVFKREIENIRYSLMETQVERTIQGAVQTTLNPAALVDSYAFSKALGELMIAQPEIKAVVVVDQDLAYLKGLYAPEPELQEVVGDVLPFGGRPVRELYDILGSHWPDWSNAEFQLSDASGVYFLHVIFDPSLPPQMASLAATRTVAFVVVIFVVAGFFISIFLIQQRLTRRLREQRDSAEQLAYVGTLAAGLAHEIRNPLNALAMQLDMLGEDVEATSPRATDRINRIREGLTGVGQTVSEFLNYASPGQQKPAMVDLENQVGAICREFNEEQARGEGHIECLVAQGLAAWCDVNALRQIIGNLLTNAWRAQAGRACGRQIRIEAAREGDWIAIRVDDAGPGVAPEVRSKLFEAFFTTSGEGSGLGLPIARRLAEMNGGRLDLADEPSSLGGARFVLRLPASSRPKR